MGYLYNGWICSVLGACLTRSELRKLARKEKFCLTPGDSDYLLHSALVSGAGSRNPMSRALNSMLNRKYRMYINRYAKAEDNETIKKLWREDIERGNVPGAYWAIMTHPAISGDVLGEIYGQVHMMGHDTHGDYRRDNKKLTGLKEKVAILEEVIGNERLDHLREKNNLQKEIMGLQEIEEQYVAVKEENVRLKLQLEQAKYSDHGSDYFKSQLDRLRQHNASLCGRIDELTSELEDKEDLLNLAQKTLNQLEEIHERLKSEKEELHQEIISFETSLMIKMQTSCTCATCEDQDTERCPGPDLCGKTVLYVGGRQSLVPMYRRLIEKYGGRFIHHDGGIEGARTKLPKMLTSADVVVCPVDCVSHDACNCVKKICKRYQKPFVMMRSSGLSSLTKGLTTAIQ